MYCLDGRGSFSFSNEDVFCLFLRSTGAITMHNMLQLSFVLFPSNRSRWFRTQLKKPWPSPCLLRSMFAFKNPLFWLFLCLWSAMAYPCFVHSYVSTQKLVRIATDKCQNCLWPQLFRALWFVDHSKPYRGFCQSFRELLLPLDVPNDDHLLWMCGHV